MAGTLRQVIRHFGGSDPLLGCQKLLTCWWSNVKFFHIGWLIRLLVARCALGWPIRLLVADAGGGGRSGCWWLVVVA